MATHPDSWASSDLSILFEISESIVREKVFDLTEADLLMPLESLMAGVLPDLLLTPPRIDWDNGQFKIEDMPAVSSWKRVELSLPIEDPTYILSYVDWLPNGDGDYRPDPAAGRLMLAEHIACETSIEAMFQFDESIRRYKADLTKLWIEAERFNDAVPYMIIRWADVRRQHLHLNRPMPNYERSRLNGLHMRFGTDSVHMMDIKAAMRKTKNDN